MSTAEATWAPNRNPGNQLFTALLGSILVAFLAAVALVLFSNFVYLSGAETEGRKGLLAALLIGLRDPDNLFALKLSMVTAAITTVLSMAVGIPVAYVLSRYRLPGSGIIDTLLDLPIVLPPPVMGLSLLVFFQTIVGRWIEGHTGPWVYTTRGVVVAQFFVACSFGIRAVKASFDTIGVRHEEVARTLGCSRRQAFFRVVLPMARTGIVAGAVMTWARAMAEFGPILFFCGTFRGKTSVMPIQMFLHYSAGDLEKGIALALIMIMISAVTLLTFKRLGGKGYIW